VSEFVDDLVLVRRAERQDPRLPGVGIAGTDEKCSWVRDELEFDAATNYRSEDIKSALTAVAGC
jgi:hypothetical protein